MFKLSKFTANQTRYFRKGSSVVGVVAPTISAIDDTTIEFSDDFNTTAELAAGSPVFWTLEASPDGMTINGATGDISWRGPHEAGNDHTVTVRATNSSGYDEESFVITVSLARTSQIERHGITWNFDSTAHPFGVRYGQFVNGDYYVLDEGSGVKISSVSPAPTTLAWSDYPGVAGAPTAGDYKINGSMVNPIFNDGVYANRHAFDERGADYTEVGSNPADSGHEYAVSYPLTLTDGDKLISTESYGDNVDNRTPLFGPSVPFYRHWLKNSAILTCLASAPAEPCFRPGFMDSDTNLYYSSAIDRDMLPGLVPPASTELTYDVTTADEDAPCTVYGAFFEKPWLLTWADTSAMVHPSEALGWYYEINAAAISDAVLLLLCNYGDIDNLLIPFIQCAIDTYYCAQRGEKLDRSIYAVVWKVAGALLNDSAMKNFDSITKPETDLYYISDKESTIDSATVPSDRTYLEYHGIVSMPDSGSPTAWRSTPGDSEFAHLDPAKMYTVSTIYYDGADAKATIQCTDKGTLLSLKTYDSNDILQSEHYYSYKYTIDQADYLAIVSDIDALSGWHASTPPDSVVIPSNVPFMRTPIDETNCKGAVNAVNLQCSEWDFVGQGGRKQLTYQASNTAPMVGFWLALKAFGMESFWSNPAFFDYIRNTWMSVDQTAHDALLSTVPNMDVLPESRWFGTTNSDFQTEMYNLYKDQF